jgi:hypothetical protein
MEDLKRLGAFFIKIQQVSTCGDPDFVLCFKGHFIGLELKTEKGRASPLQIYKLNQIVKKGGTAFIARPSSWQVVLDSIRQLDDTQRKEIPACLKLPSVS